MHRVCGTTEVGQRIPLRRVLQRQGFWECHYYYDVYSALLTTRLASMGSLEACYLTGLRPIFVESYMSLTPPMEWLQHSAEAGYKLGMYVYALVLYRSNIGGDNDDIARRLLRELKVLTKRGRLHCCGRTRPFCSSAETCTCGSRTWCHMM